MASPPGLPPKKDVALALLRQSSVFIHLDPRHESVRVPLGFKKQPQLILQIGLNMAVPIRDLDVSDEAISCTLSFSRTPHFCWIPWQAIFALIGENGPGMVWPDDVPQEVAAQQQQRAEAGPKLRAVPSEAKPKEPEAPPAAAKETKEAAPEAAPKKKRARKPVAAKRAAETAPAASVEPATPRARSGRKGEPAPAAKRKIAAADSSSSASAVSSSPSPDSKPRRELPPYLRVIK